MKKSIRILALALGVMLLVSACVSGGASTPAPFPTESPAQTVQPEASATEAAEPETNEPAPSDEEEQPGVMSGFTAVDLEGNEVDDSIFEDYQVTMINAWGTFCGPCIKEMPELGELSEEYADEDVRIVGLVTDVLNYDGSVNEEQVSIAAEIVEETGADYLHILPTGDLIGLLMQITAVPTTFFVDSEGRQVGNAYLGAKSKEDWAAILDDLLEEAA